MNRSMQLQTIFSLPNDIRRFEKSVYMRVVWILMNCYITSHCLLSSNNNVH